MKVDPIMAFLYKVRSEILKQGKLDTGVILHVGYLDTALLQTAMQNPPPGAKSFFVGDHLGGSGRQVALPNGDVEKYYVALEKIPGVDITASVYLADAPVQLRDKTMPELCEHYLAFLSSLVSDARTVLVK